MEAKWLLGVVADGRMIDEDVVSVRIKCVKREGAKGEPVECMPSG